MRTLLGLSLPQFLLLGLAAAVPLSAETVTLVLVSAGAAEADQRWRDVADNGYAPAYVATDQYALAVVRFTYETEGTTFTGRLVGQNLKPFHAYQIKFVAPHGYESMERIGRLGRWWAGGAPLNVSDDYYEANEDVIDFDSFLVLDYFVTDEEGGVDKRLSLDSTYHVLWRYGSLGAMVGQRDRENDDGPSVGARVVPDDDLDPDGSPLTPGPYLADEPALDVNVYGEREQSAGNVRPAPGDAELPVGSYTVQLVLTEEGFHSFGANQGGNYATVLRSPNGTDVSFTIVEDAGNDDDDDEEDGVVVSVSSGGSCFIATAAFGTPDRPPVEGLRGFRDRRLRPSRLGSAFVRIYYRNSPPAAAYLRRSAALRCAIRALLAAPCRATSAMEWPWPRR